MRISRIEIQVIPHNEQRYDTVGDWTIEPVTGESGLLRIYVSRLPKNSSEWIVAIHELVESLLCHFDGITHEEVDKFDMAPENQFLNDPGLSTSAPYHQQHMAADVIERMFVQLLGREWIIYENELQTPQHTSKEEK